MPVVGIVLAGLLVAAAASVGVVIGVRVATDEDTAALREGSAWIAGMTTTTTEVIPLSFTAEEIADEFGPSVWRVESSGCGELWTGTAFAIDEHHFVTNHHVVANDTTPSLVSRDGDRSSATVIGWSERPDVAVLRVDEPRDRWLDWAPTDELRVGQNIVALGYPVPATDFTVTPGTILSFQSRTDVTEAVRTNAAIDRGNSGGPALDAQGRVVGVVTEMAPNWDGFQLVPLVFTYDALSELIDEFLADPEEPDVDCDETRWWESGGGQGDPETWSSDADTYGDDSTLDVLWDACEDGDFEACDDLWYLSPAGSDYEEFGDTCGQRNKPSGWCIDIHG
ncbi:MAG: S1C family serine protease [Acidimicrobiales bacterium]